MTLIKAFEALPDGKRLLASARLRRNVVKELRKAELKSGKSKADIARELGVTRSAVTQVFASNGNLKLDTISDYFFVLGAKLNFNVEYSDVPAMEVTNPWEQFKSNVTSSDISFALESANSESFVSDSKSAVVLTPDVLAWKSESAA